MIGWRVDQTLASKAFLYQITGESKEVSELLLEASNLAGKSERTRKEEKRYAKIKQAILKARLCDRQTEAEDEIERNIVDYMIKEIDRREKKIFGERDD